MKYIIKDKRVLVIPDIHQNVGWAKHILTLVEKDNYDTVVFLGDFFDSHLEPPIVWSVSDTAEFLLELLNGKYGDCRVLLGNHDLAYLESWKYTHLFRNPKYLYNACSGYTNTKASKINKILHIEDWKKIDLFCYANGWLLSHAGFNAKYFPYTPSIEESLFRLDHQFREAINMINFCHHDLFDCSVNDSGRQATSGPLWCRPDDFQDELPFPQIFGHTHSGVANANIFGRSFNIDGGQSTYLIIAPDGNIQLKAFCKKTFLPLNATIQKYWTPKELKEHVQKAIAKIEAQENQ